MVKINGGFGRVRIGLGEGAVHFRFPWFEEEAGGTAFRKYVMRHLSKNVYNYFHNFTFILDNNITQ